MMRHFTGAALAVILVPVMVVWLMWFEPSLAPTMQPLTQSPAALYSSVAIYVVFVAMALFAFFRGWQRVRREDQVVAFLRAQVDALAEGAWQYVPSADDAVASGIFGSRDAELRQRTSTGRIVSLLHADARFFRFEPVHLALRTELPALHAHSTRIGSYQTLAVRAGILGTFFGLIQSLSNVQNVFMWRGTELANSPNAASLNAELEGIRDNIAGLMGEVVQGLAIAFGTSIAGLIAAFVIFFLAAQAREDERRLAEDIHAICQRVQKLFRNHTNQNTELVHTADALRGVMKENLAMLSSANKSLNENATQLSETSGKLGTALTEPVQLFASNAAALKQLLEQSAIAADAAREVSASLSTAEKGAAKRMEAIATELTGLVERNHRDLATAIETNNKMAAETGNAIAGSVVDAMRTLSSELASGLPQKLGGELQQEVLAGLLAELGKMHEAHAASIRQISSEGRRQTRIALAMTAMLLLTAGGLGFSLHGYDVAALLQEAMNGSGLSAPAAPEAYGNVQ
ncbi:hypothetical protein [Rhizobium sp. RU36D]|uniref:hypothetical protein n=1 Tax=Rhizobium sp. RU36D TaxID=1907415 RepID=UPI0009D8EC0A|nr:hypothetical protein [Rhizobium sp. RU36D]SMC75969.1 hypothetical protein SAMN05880593_10629 [Rhizobium sp. RU36D]